jgi:hypothetical protein
MEKQQEFQKVMVTLLQHTLIHKQFVELFVQAFIQRYV